MARGRGTDTHTWQTLFSTWGHSVPTNITCSEACIPQASEFFFGGWPQITVYCVVLEIGKSLTHITHVILIFLKLPTLYLNMHKDEHGLHSILGNHSNLLFWNCLSYSGHWWLLTLNPERGERATRLLVQSKCSPNLALSRPGASWDSTPVPGASLGHPGSVGRTTQNVVRGPQVPSACSAIYIFRYHSPKLVFISEKEKKSWHL